MTVIFASCLLTINMAGIGVQVVKSAGKTMFSRNTYAILRRSQCNILTKSIKYSTSSVNESGDRDPAPFFFNEDVQNLLKTLTRPDPKKIFRKRKDGSKIKDPEYKFMTDEELKKQVKEAEERGMRRLQMPPVVKKRTEVDKVLSKDSALQGYDTAKYVFTDISYPMNDYQRLIVIREPNGVLRHAKWDERHRLNQIYYPLKGRELVAPRMFQEEYLKELLNQQEYEFILDRACLQYEPNDPEFHRITEAVYSVINKEKHFNHLRSTRHFGPLVFHLVWTRNMENLLLENIREERLEDAVLLINLYNKIYPNAKSAKLKHDGDDIKFIHGYINLEVASKGKLELAIQALKEIINAREIVAEGVKKAHGL